MIYSKLEIQEFENRVKQGYLRKVEQDGLVLYGYTDKCSFEKAWDQYTLVARGIIIDKATGVVVAHPFYKFFNINEIEETELQNLPVDKGYHVFDKVDGSLGIIYFHGGQWKMATRGSFSSEQAIKGREILNKYRTRYLDKNFTYLVEIIYPKNKIIVDYGDEEKLVLLSAFHTSSGKEINPEVMGYVSQQLGMESAMMYPYTIDEMISLQKTLPKEQEGFVVRFSGGMRVKIKGYEYMKLSRALSDLCPLSIWEAMDNGVVNRTYLSQIPEEFKKIYEPIVRDLEEYYHMIVKQMLEDYEVLPIKNVKNDEDRKYIAEFVRASSVIKHPSIVFAMIDKKWKTTDKYIMNRIRPKGNVLREIR